MVVGQHQPQMHFQPPAVFTKGVGLARQASSMLTQGQVFAFNETGIDAGTHARGRQALIYSRLIAKDDFAAHRHNLPVFTLLDDLRIEQIGMWDAPRLWMRSALALARRLIPLTIAMQQRAAVFRQLITRKER